MATTNQKPKRKHSGNSPPKRTPKNIKNSEANCIVCKEPILEAGEHCKGDEAVFCEGDCQGWIHRKCAGVTRSAFDKLGETDAKYLCSQCMLASQNREISKLTDTIKNLNASIALLTKTITSLQSSVMPAKQFSASDQTPRDEQPSNITRHKPKPSGTPLHNLRDEKKFEVVVYGLLLKLTDPNVFNLIYKKYLISSPAFIVVSRAATLKTCSD